MPRVSVIILNWNGLNLLQECLESLAEQIFRDFEVILVDNGSSDGSQNFVKRNFPWVKLLELDHNSGFAAGNVAGYQKSLGSMIVTLNNDTAVDRYWLSELVKTAEENPGAGMIASRICSYFNHDVIDSLGVKICLDGMSRGDFRGRLYSTLRDVPETVLLPSACAALYRREMLDDTGFFDEKFFAYCEDTDLGLRARRAGWQARLAKNAIVYHKYSVTAGSFSPFKLFLVERNHFWAVFKSFPAILLLLMPLTTLMRYLAQIVAVARSSGSGKDFMGSVNRMACAIALIRAFIMAFASPGELILQRKEAMKVSRISDHKFLRLILKNRMKFSELLDMG